MNFESDQGDNIVVAENAALYDAETTGYGLDTVETINSTEPQLDSIQSENLSLETIEPLQPDQDDSHQLVFIDSTVEDIETLADNISGATEVVVLNSEQDELLQISEHLSNYEDLDAIHIVSHGEPGQLSFGNTDLDSDTLPEYKEVLENWRLSFDPQADLLLYGCDVASEEDGLHFTEELSQVTGADVAASIDDTGIDGNWELEATVGEVETTPIFDSQIDGAYQHNLQDITIAPTDLPDFGSTGLDNTGFDFTTVPADDLTIFAEEGVDFGDVDSGTLSNIDFNQIPLEDFQILADAGLTLEPLSPEQISQINLNALSGLNYLQGIDFTAIEGLSGETSFAQLSNTVVAKAHLFDYKTAALELDSGLSIEQLSQFNQSDFNAIDYAFEGDEAFDSNFYLANNPDVKDAEVNPFAHYIELGASEGRDPNATFDSDFYLADNPDVRDAGVNPFEHYQRIGISEDNRFPNQVFKSFDTSEEAIIVASSDLSNVDFGTIKSFATITETENPEVAVAPLAIPVIIKLGAELVIYTGLSIALIKQSNDLLQALQESDVQLFSSSGEDINTSTPPFDLGKVTNVNPETFPDGNQFIQDIQDGRFEFPEGNESLFTGNFQSINSGDSNIINDDSLWDDVDASGDVSTPGVLNPEANDIANGHAFPKHRNEFPGIETREDFAQKVDEVINDPTVEEKLNLDNDRRAYWQDATGTLVIANPNDPDGGTMYKPDKGRQDFDELD